MSPIIETNTKDEATTSPKVNAFQFMMNSRHKVIGSNSPGKDKKDVLLSPENEKDKGKLSKRKAAFENWAEKKGGTKRKLADEAAEKHINTTLRKRAKRLKQMLAIIDEELKNSGEETSDNEEIIKVKTKKHRAPLLASESSNDSEIFNTVNEKSSIETKELKSAVVTKESKSTVEAKVSKSTEETKESKSIVEVKVSKSTEETKESKSTVETKESKSTVETKESKSTDENESQEKTQSTDLKSPKIKKNDKENNKELKTPSKKTKTPKKKIHKRSLSLKKSAEKDKKENNNEFSDEEIFPKSQKSALTPKKTRQLKLTNSNESNVGKKECFSPRTWKMRVRLVEHEKENDAHSDTSEKTEKSESQSSEDIVIGDDSQKSTSDSQKSVSDSQKSVSDSQKSVSDSQKSVSDSQKSESTSSDSDKKPVKLAPIFMMQQQKKLNKEALNAKKSFLHSGVPSKVKKLMTKTKSFQEPEFVLSLFPKISHIQQRDEILNYFWNLPVTELPLIDLDLSIKKLFNEIKIGTFTNCTSLQTDTQTKNYNIPSKYTNLKKIVKEIKKDYPAYPVYKTFRLLYQKYEKHAKNVETPPEKTPAKKGRGRKKKIKKPEPVNNFGSLMWTEKYKPQSQEDIIGNSSAVQELKSWLESWIRYSEEQKTTRKRRDSSSDDFYSDSTTKDSGSLPQNIVMLFGPIGCGKTCSVYGLCQELSINVIEINASSKRPGKKILADLQEATQSHQVKNTDSKSASFFQKKTQTEDEINKKLSLLLFEDVDIVFEEDDNFISALTTLIMSSKRPIILTSSDKKCLHLQKFIMQYQVIYFNNLTGKILSPWLQILSLIEGVKADKNTIDKLVEWNKGDVRKILLHLQFWVQTGGSPENKLKIELESVSEVSVDEDSNLSWLETEDTKEENYWCHKNCSESFIPYYERDKPGFKLSYPVNLESLWWNVPEILDQKSETETEKSFEDLKIVTNFLESLSLADIFQTNLQIESNTEPICNYWQINPINSLSFDQNYSTYNKNNETSLEIAHWLVESNVKFCQKFRNNESIEEINTTIPYFEELSCRTNRHKSMKGLLNAIPTHILDRTAICLDYQTMLRTICRIENERSIANTKRKNRFYHYLKNFNIHLNDSAYLLLCNTFSNKC